MCLSLALPLTEGQGRSIQLDLSQSTKTQIGKIRYITLEITNDPANSILLILLGTDSARVLPLNNSPLSDITVYNVHPTTTQSGRCIGMDLKQHVKTINSNISSAQFFRYPNMAADARFYKLGGLNLPLNGHQAAITVNLCYGFHVTNCGLNSCWLCDPGL